MHTTIKTGIIPSRYTATKWLNKEEEQHFVFCSEELRSLIEENKSLRKNSPKNAEIDAKIAEKHEQIKSLKTVVDFDVATEMLNNLKKYAEELRLDYLKLVGKLPYEGINHIEWHIVDMIKTQFKYELVNKFLYFIEVYQERVNTNPTLKEFTDPFTILAHCETLFNRTIQEMVTGEFASITAVSSSEGHNFVKKCKLECLLEVMKDGVQGHYSTTKFNAIYDDLISGGFLNRVSYEEFCKMR